MSFTGGSQASPPGPQMQSSRFNSPTSTPGHRPGQPPERRLPGEVGHPSSDLHAPPATASHPLGAGTPPGNPMLGRGGQTFRVLSFLWPSPPLHRARPPAPPYTISVFLLSDLLLSLSSSNGGRQITSTARLLAVPGLVLLVRGAPRVACLFRHTCLAVPNALRLCLERTNHQSSAAGRITNAVLPLHQSLGPLTRAGRPAGELRGPLLASKPRPTTDHSGIEVAQLLQRCEIPRPRSPGRKHFRLPGRELGGA